MCSNNFTVVLLRYSSLSITFIAAYLQERLLQCHQEHFYILYNVKYNLHLRHWLRGLHPGLYLHTASYRFKFLRTTWIWYFDLYITGFDNIDPPRNLFTYRQAIAIRFLILTQEKILTKSNCQKKKVVNETVPI